MFLFNIRLFKTGIIAGDIEINILTFAYKDFHSEIRNETCSERNDEY